ncbi:MAG: hypothetical protein K2P81_10945 [Bacteriovoracaceae bacterium]|nr:hypothetical protein [Bacteriovoracaceae bacterium]
MKRFIAFLLLCAMLNSMAQDQMMIRVNHTGVIQIMRMALKYNQQGQGKPGFKIPRGIYSFSIPRSQVANNPIIKILNEISDVNFNRDYPFYITNSDVTVVGEIDESSLRSAVSNYTDKGFDLKLTFSIDKLSLKVADLSMCETKYGSRCGKGLKASFNNVGISMKSGSRISMSTDFKVVFEADQARLKLVKATSNLGQANGPKLDISIGGVTIPPISIVINGQEAQLDTSALKDEILQYKAFLAQKLLSFAGEFIAEDMAEMVNKALKNECIPTQLRVLEMGSEDKPATFGGFTPVPYVIVADNTRVYRRPLPPELMRYRGDIKAPPTYMELLQQDLANIIKSARVDIKLKSIRTPVNQDIEIRANGSLKMNRRFWNVQNTVGHSTRVLPALNIDTTVSRNDHFAVVIAEPVINAASDLFSSIGVYQKVLDSQVKMGGVYVDSIKVHFKNGSTQATDKIYLIANAKVNLREMDADGVWAWIKKALAVWLERNNNNAILRFPIQIEAIPRIVQTSTGIKLMLRVNSPFASENALKNDFNYPNNVTSATSIVRSTVMDLLRENLASNTNKEFEIPLDSYLSQKGVTVTPKSIRMINSAYMMVSADLKDLDFSALQSTGNAGGSCQ